jgi:hypothetical protein
MKWVLSLNTCFFKGERKLFAPTESTTRSVSEASAASVGHTLRKELFLIKFNKRQNN